MASRIVPEGGWGSRLKPFKRPRQYKESHLEFLKQLPCVICATQGLVTPGTDAAHLRAGSRRHAKRHVGMGEKPDDRWALPLCRSHHREQHAQNELAFWSDYRVDPFLMALVLWGITGDVHAASQFIVLHARDAIG